MTQESQGKRVVISTLGSFGDLHPYIAIALELKRRGGGTGVAALCGGGGQGDALIVKVPAS